MRIIRKYAIIISAAIMLLGLVTAHADEPKAKYKVQFRYDNTLNEYVGQVYLETDVSLSSGSFGIRYSPTLINDISFELDTDNFMYASMPYSPTPDPDTYTLEDGTFYKAFSWNWKKPYELEGHWHLGDIHVKNVTMTTDTNGDPIPKGWHKQTMYQLDWLGTDLSQTEFFKDTSYGVGNDGSLNSEIWRALTEEELEDEELTQNNISGYYQGQDTGTDPDNPEWIDIGYELDFGGILPNPPEGNVVVGNILSYNPNNDITVTLRDKDENICGTVSVDTKKVFDDGRVLSMYTIEEVDSGKYILEVKKSQHLTYTAEIEVSGDDLAHNVGQMSCGDVNGDGRIKLNDRSMLIRCLNRRGSQCDLNGDGRVTVHDLDILKRYYNEIAKGVG